MSGGLSRLPIAPLPATVLTLAGLALVGFAGGAGTALLTAPETIPGADSRATEEVAIDQAGITVTRAPSSLATSLSTSIATSTAPAASVTSSSTTSSATSGSSTVPTRPTQARRGPSSPAPVPAPAPRAVAAPQQHVPAPQQAPPPQPEPAVPPPIPPLIDIPAITLTRQPVIPQQPIQIQELRIG